MRFFLIIATLFSCSSLTEAKCWSTKPYQLAAITFAEGVGNLSSSYSICRYGDDSHIHSTCSNACWGLITATWGDCYCEYPDFKPKVSNQLVKSLTVQEIFTLLATPEKWNFRGASCQDKLNQSANRAKWQCT